jgi:hypothetical protein
MLLLAIPFVTPIQGANATGRFVEMPLKHDAFFSTYCVHCHDSQTQEGMTRLDDIPFSITDIPAAERWQKVLGVLNAGEMPPKKETQPQADEKAALLEDLSKTMVGARKMLSDIVGATTMRRLNRRDYVNTIQSLLGVRVSVEGLPADTNPGGFDTSGGALFFSSDQFEQYLKVARRALDQVIVIGEKPEMKIVRIEAEDEANTRITGILRGYQMGGYRKYKMWKASDAFVEVGFRGESIESAMDLIACRKVRSPIRNPGIIEVEVDIPPLIDRLKASKEPDGGTLFDNVCLAYGSNIQSIHYLSNCPTLVTGGGAGIKLGQHIVLPNEKTPLCDLWLTLLQGIGIKVNSHGDSTGVLRELIG